jgi:hypothetical protein
MDTTDRVIAQLEAEVKSVAVENRDLQARQEALRISRAVGDHEELFKLVYQGAKDTTVTPLSGGLLEELTLTLDNGILSDHASITPQMKVILQELKKKISGRGIESWSVLIHEFQLADEGKKLKIFNKINMDTLKEKNRPCIFELPGACIQRLSGCDVTSSIFQQRWDDWWNEATGESGELGTWWNDKQQHFGNELTAIWRIGIKVYDTFLFDMVNFAASRTRRGFLEVISAVQEIQAGLPWCLSVHGMLFLTDVVLGMGLDIVALDECEFLFGQDKDVIEETISENGYE